MTSLIFGSLSRQADAWLREWKKNSGDSGPHFSKSRRLFFLLAEQPMAHLAVVFVAIFLVSISCEMFTSVTGIPKLTTDYEKGDFLAFFTALWSLQATLAALVYPLVIAFIAVLLQRRASAKFSLRLYVLDSAMVPAGASALMLVAWMTIQYSVLPYVSLEIIAAAMAGNITWALYNILLTGWFIYRTVLFFDDEVRYRAFARYAVHKAFRREVRLNLLGLTLSNAQNNGVLPKGTEHDAEAGALVNIFPSRDGVPCVVRANPERKAVIDVRMRLLKWAIQLWLRGISREDGSQNALSYSKRPTFTFPIVPGIEGSEELVICRIKNAKSPGWFIRFLIRHSVVLGKPTFGPTSAATSEILEELAVEALTLVEDKRFEAARETVEALIEVHAALLRAGNFNGEVQHAGLIPSPYGWGGEAIHKKWLSAYSSLADASVSLLSSEMDVYSLQCYVFQRLAGRVSKAPAEVLTSLVYIPDYLSYRLGQWWANQVAEHGIGPHNVNVAVLLPNPSQVTYERAIKKFVEGWEFAQIYPRDEDYVGGDGAWQTHAHAGKFEAAKLNRLAYMILAAASRGDRTCAIWLIDSFMSWATQSHHISHYVNFDERRYRLAGLSSFNEPWSAIRTQLGVEDDEHDATHAKRAFETALRDYWEDLRLVLVLLLFDWSDASQVATSFSLELVTDLLAGRNPKTAQRCLEKLNDVEAILVRFFKMDDDHLIRDAAELQRPEMVAGRVYSRAGADDLDSLLESQVMLLAAIVTSEVSRTLKLDALLAQNSSNLRELSRFQRRATDLADRLDALAIGPSAAVFSIVRSRLDMNGTPADAIDWVSAMLRAFASSAKEVYDSVVSRSTISQARLSSIEDCVNRLVLSGEVTDFPFSVCKSIALGSRAIPEQRLNFTDISRESLAEPSLHEWTPYEASWYNERVVDTIASTIVKKYLREHRTVALSSVDEAQFAAELRQHSSEIRQRGRTPIVLLPLHRPDWVSPYRYPAMGEGPEIIATTPPRAGDAPSVHSYIDGVAAHNISLAGAGCFVVPLEDFVQLNYQLYATERCVQVSVTEEAENKLTVSFCWKFAA
jgi:hypothetical protein